MEKVDTLIIGAGVSGLSYAIFCNEDFLIVEKEPVAGGLCRTFYKDEFVWDYAGHFFHFSNPEIKEYFGKKIKQSDLVTQTKNTYIFYKNSLIDFPFQKNIHQLPKEEFINCLYDLFFKNEKEAYSSFEDMLYGKFGKSITDLFLKPYNEKLYACHLNELDQNAMGRFFPYTDTTEIIKNFKIKNNNSYNTTFDYPKRGAQVFVDALLDDIDSGRIMYNCEITQINPEKKEAIINDRIIKYNKLVNTIPLKNFLLLLPKKYHDNNQILKANKVLVFNIGFDTPPNNRTVHWIYFPQKDINFYRVGFYNNILNKEKMSIYVEIGFSEKSDINLESEYKSTISNLKKVGIITDQKICAYNSLIIDPGYVHITPDSIKFCNEMISELSKYNIYIVGRYALWTYCSIEDCIQAAKTLSKKTN